MLRLLTATVLCTASLAFAALPEVVKIDAGQLSGVPGKDPNVRVFRGVPYGAPPVGENRWKAPQPVAKWDGVRKADTFSPGCANGLPAAGGGKGKGPTSSEDCLYLNIWTAAASAGDKRPVIVWNYGGGFTVGNGASGQFDGEALAKKGAIVVTYNYRLGHFGYLAHPELTKESGHNASGNYGMMDLAACLRWVQKNIAAFGGDPGRVTINGESAGAILVSSLVGSPEGKGLFHRAISQSGGWMGLSIAKIKPRKEVEDAAVKAAGGATLAQLRAMSVDQLSQTLRGVPTTLVVDGWMIPEDESVTFAASKQNKVEVLVGSNQDEGTFFGAAPNAEQFQAQMSQRFGDLMPEFLKVYPATNNDEAKASHLTRIRDEVGWHMRLWAGAQTKAGKKAFVYYFQRVNPGAGARGATHGAEIPYMFGNAGNAWVDADTKLSDVMTSYWVNFAATGDPNGKGLPVWEAYDAKKNDGRAMVFGDTAGMGTQVGVDRLKFYDAAYAKLK